MIIKVLIVSPSPEQRAFLMSLSAANMEGAVFITEDCLCTARECSDGPCCDMMIVGGRWDISAFEFIKTLEGRGCHCPPQRRALLALVPHGPEITQASALGMKVFSPPLKKSEFRQWVQDCQSEVAAVSPDAETPQVLGGPDVSALVSCLVSSVL